MAGQSCFSLVRTPMDTGPEAPSPEVVRLGRSQQGHLESRADSVGGRALGPGAFALIISSAYVSYGRLLQYLLNNQPRNSIVQDKNEKH